MKFVQIHPWGFWANKRNKTNFLIFIYLFIHSFIYLNLFFGNSPTGQTLRRIFTLHGSNDADSRIDVPFGGFVDIALHFEF